MLGQRRRNSGSRRFFNNTVFAWGGGGAKNGGGYYRLRPSLYPQGMPNLTKVVQCAAPAGIGLILKDDGTMWSFGGNSEVGSAGLGFSGENVEEPTRITGGVPLYPREDLIVNNAKTGLREPFEQPQGPMAPTIPSTLDISAKNILDGKIATWTIRSVATGSSHSAALTTDGRVLTWGSNKGGALGNGQEGAGAGITARVEGEKEENNWPQMTPYWVLTAPGPNTSGPKKGTQEVAPGETNVLKNVKAIAAGISTTFYLLENGEVWYSGKPSGTPIKETPHIYAQKDPAYTPSLHAPVGAKAIAIAATVGAYLLLFDNGEVRFVGNNEEYCAGSGVEKSATSTTREVISPKYSTGENIKNIKAIAKAEYSCKFLRIDGVLLTCGSNGTETSQGFREEGQQGLGQRTEPVHYATPIPQSSFDNLEVIAISSTGEQRGNGENGGDNCIALLSDHTTRVWGPNWGIGTSAGTTWEPFGLLGTGVTESSNIPIRPLSTSQVPLNNIRQIYSGPTTMFVVREPGIPPIPTLITTSPGPGKAFIELNEPPGKEGELPIWRGEEKWTFLIAGEGPLEVTKTKFTSGAQSSTVKKWEFTAVPPGIYKATVNGTQKAQTITVEGGSIKTAIGKEILVKWILPPKLEPSYIVEWRRVETFLKSGVPTKEDWKRATPEATGSSFLLKMTPSAHGLEAFEEIEIRITGSFEGAYTERHRQLFVLPNIGAPINVSIPRIAGVNSLATIPVGTTLTTSHGSWTNVPTSYSYQWYREPLKGNIVLIAGATSQSYTTVAEDKGFHILVAETAINAAGSSAAEFSTVTIPVS